VRKKERGGGVFFRRSVEVVVNGFLSLPLRPDFRRSVRIRVRSPCASALVPLSGAQEKRRVFFSLFSLLRPPEDEEKEEYEKALPPSSRGGSPWKIEDRPFFPLLLFFYEY